jgi:lipoprotein-releasing system permease protein
MLRGQGKFSRPIVSIAILGIILGVAIMLVTMSIVRGFRSEVREKVVAFNSHIQVKDLAALYTNESNRIEIDPEYLGIADIEGVNHVQLLVQRPAILETDEGINGIVAKGAGPDFNWEYFKSKTVEGSIPNTVGDTLQNEVFISKAIANKLLVGVGDKVSVYFIKNQEDISTRRLKISGLFKTDLEEFDMQFIFMDIRHLQKVNNWGLQVQLLVGDSCNDKGVSVEALSFGGDGRHYYEWNKPWRGKGPHFICPDQVDQVRVVLHDDVETLSDTAYADIKVSNGTCSCENIRAEVLTSGGSQKYYTGGYEVFISDFDELKTVEANVFTKVSPFLATTNLVNQTPEIFSWLELFDVNVYIIIVLMIGVAIINMSSALLIMILERSSMIGILKSMGSNDWSVRKIFMRNAAVLIAKGLFWGNFFGIGLALIQKHFNVIKLPAESYYLNTVPILLDIRDILLIDIGTLVICITALVIPSWLITRISPVRAIRFD